MNDLAGALNGAVWGLALAGTVWAALRLAPRRVLGASARYVLLWIAMAAVLALPLASLRPESAAARRLARPAEAQTVRIPEVERIPLPKSQAPAWRGLAVPTGRWLEGAGLVWLSVAALLLVRLALSLSAIGRARRRARPAPEPWPAKVPGWLAAVGAGRRSIRLAASRDLAVPAAAGPASPAILIPERLFAEATEADIERIGLHEAAHFARRDDWALLGQRAIEAVLWIHPAVRLLGRELDMEREIACDERVVRATGEPRAYAACLTRMIELCGESGLAPVPTMADRRPRIARRIELVLQGTGTAAGNRLGLAAAIVALAAGAVAFAKAPAVLKFSAPRSGGPAIMLIEQHPEPATPNQSFAEEPMNRSVNRVRHAAAVVALGTLAAAAKPQAQPAPAHTPQKMIALYFDLSAIDSSQLASLVGGVRKFVAAQKSSGLMAVIAFDGSTVRVLQDFTNDTAAVDAVLDHLALPGSNAVFARTSADGLMEVVERLGAIEGKKMMVYTTGIPPDHSEAAAWRGVIDAAIRAQVAFYPIDRGVH